MKGFVYVVEISFAIFIFAVSLWTAISSVDIKSPRDIHELTSTGLALTNILNTYDINILLNNTSFFVNEMDYFVPNNMYWGAEIKGAPKPVIEIGCANCTGKDVLFLREILTPVYYNKRFVNFSVSYINFTSLDKAFQYDTLVFVNFTDFDNNALIQEYLKKGGKIIAITDITSNQELSKMDDTFSLSKLQGNPNANYFAFSDYLASYPYIQKYFIGTGFRVEANKKIDNKNQGIWRIWLDDREVNITSDLKVEIEGIGKLKEGDEFSLNPHSIDSQLPNKNYFFKIKKVFPKEVYIQPLNTSFVFLPSIIGDNEIKVKANKGKNVLLSFPVQGNQYSSAIVNTTTSRAVWISYFPVSSEFELLVKASILAINDEFTLKTFYGEKGIAIPYYTSTCCDIPELLKITLHLGYKY